MTSLPFVFCIHGSDAPQHLGKMQSVMSQFKAENRIENFVALEINSALSDLEGRFKTGATVVLFLTHELGTRRNEISNLIRRLKSRFADTSVVEIIVDNVPFEHEYIALPTNLKPIRDTQNMDLTWADIEQSLKEILPPHKIPQKRKLSSYLKYLIIIVVILILVIWKFSGNNAPPPSYDEAIPDTRADTIKR